MNRFFASLAVLAAAASTAAAAAPTDLVLVTVNGVPIRRSEVVERLLKRYGASAVDEMIDETLLRQAAKKSGVEAPDAEVTRRLNKLQAQFGSREMFISQLEQAGKSVSQIKEDLAEGIVREMLVVKAAGLSVSDEDLKKSFEAHKDKLGAPEAVHLRMIRVATDAEAKNLVKQIKNGADFGTLAREKSLAPSGKAAGGDYDFVARGTILPPEVDEIAFAMKAGDIRIVPLAGASHILQVVETRPAKPASFAEVKDDLREMMMADLIQKAAPAYLSDLRRKAEIKSSAAVPAAAKAKN